MKNVIALALLACPMLVLAKGDDENPVIVIVDNIPGVEVVNTPNVSISGTPSVAISGTPDVTVTNEVATDPRVRQISALDVTGFGYIYDFSKVCDDPGNSPPCRLWQIDAPPPASLTHLSVAVGESTLAGTSRCAASIVVKDETLGVYRALINLRSQAGQLRTFERTYPLPIEFSSPDTVVEISLNRVSGTGNCMLEISGFGSSTPLD